MKTHNKPVIMIDFGGVYFTEGIPIALKRMSKKFKTPAEKLKKALTGSHWNKYKINKISGKEYWKEVQRRTGFPKARIKEIEHIWFSSYTPQKGMKQLVGKIRKKYRVVVLSGNVKDRVKFLHRKYKVLDEFHEHHFSFDHGFRKQDVRLFKSAVKRMGLSPKDCIVVDDKKEFVEKVEKAGGKGIVFKNAKQLESQLRRHGVKI